MKNIKIIVLLSLLASAIFILITDLMFNIYPIKRSDMAWGMTVFFGYFHFPLICFLSILIWNMKKKKWIIYILIFLYCFFIFFWIPAYPHYPHRVLFVLLFSLSIYSLLQISIYFLRRDKNKDG